MGVFWYVMTLDNSDLLIIRGVCLIKKNRFHAHTLIVAMPEHNSNKVFQESLHTTHIQLDHCESKMSFCTRLKGQMRMKYQSSGLIYLALSGRPQMWLVCILSGLNLNQMLTGIAQHQKTGSNPCVCRGRRKSSTAHVNTHPFAPPIITRWECKSMLLENKISHPNPPIITPHINRQVRVSNK